MKDETRKRVELLPEVDPEVVRQTIRPEQTPVFAPVFDPDYDDAEWLLGDDPEASVSRIADRRSVIKRQLRSEGAQFVYGLIMFSAALGSVALAATIQTWPFVAAAGMIFPLGCWWFRTGWRRWIGAAPYCYRLLTSLGEDAENVLVAHEQRQRAKYVRQIGDLYQHSRPKKRMTK